LIPVGFGDGDGDEFFLQGWVWDSETRPRPSPLPSLYPINVGIFHQNGNEFGQYP